MNNQHISFMKRAIELAELGMNANEGGPFGCVIVKDGKIIAEGHNMVTLKNDPTAHAEIVAIRHACEKLGGFQLDDCVIYASCEPCPMCLGAIYWARPRALYYACTKADAAKIAFDDAFIYNEIAKPHAEKSIPFIPLLRDEGLKVFQAWDEKQDKVTY
jgi:tRNA(Arg) A34 adenosine deaminase TadA